MRTHYLGDAEVDAYAADLAQRLIQNSDNFPRLWFTLGISGHKMASAVLGHIPKDLRSAIQFVRTNCNRSTCQAEFVDPLPPEAGGHIALVIDSAIHSGDTMLAVVRAVSAWGVQDIVSYSLVAKLGSKFIPNYFGLIIEDADRAYFQLPIIPNNRLKQKVPFGHLRELAKDDCLKPGFIDTGLQSIDGKSWGDLYYEKATRGSHVYLYERANDICGFVSFERRGRAVFIDAVATSTAYRGKGIGGLLIRWAETWARQAGCDAVELWAIQNRVDFYVDMQYLVTNAPIDLGDGEVYVPMRKKLLYNFKVVDGPGLVNEQPTA